MNDDPFHCETPLLPRAQKGSSRVISHRAAKIRWKRKGEKDGPIYLGQHQIVECIPCKAMRG